MADSRKKTAGRKKPVSGAQGSAHTGRRNKVKEEILTLVMLAVAILLFKSKLGA